MSITAQQARENSSRQDRLILSEVDYWILSISTLIEITSLNTNHKVVRWIYAKGEYYDDVVPKVIAHFKDKGFNVNNVDAIISCGVIKVSW